MPRLSAIVLEQLYIDREYQVGEIFHQPQGFTDSAFVDQWILGRLGDFDQTELERRLQDLLAEPDYIELRRSMLKCGNCKT